MGLLPAPQVARPIQIQAEADQTEGAPPRVPPQAVKGLPEHLFGAQSGLRIGLHGLDAPPPRPPEPVQADRQRRRQREEEQPPAPQEPHGQLPGRRIPGGAQDGADPLLLGDPGGIPAEIGLKPARGYLGEPELNGGLLPFGPADKKDHRLPVGMGIAAAVRAAGDEIHLLALRQLRPAVGRAGLQIAQLIAAVPGECAEKIGDGALIGSALRVVVFHWIEFRIPGHIDACSVCLQTAPLFSY